MNSQVFAEWFHRLFASSVSLGLLMGTFLILRNSQLRRDFARWCTLSLGLLALQIILGALTVTGLLKSEIVTSHLGVGFLFFGSIVWTALKLNRWGSDSQTSSSRRLSIFALTAALVVYIQVLLGGSVASNYAGLACPDFPKCLGFWWPPMERHVLIQMAHRIGAVLVFGKVLSLYFKTRRLGAPLRLERWARLALVLMVSQIILGIAAVLMQLPLPVSVLHTAMAAGLFGTLLVLSYEAAFD